MTARYSSPELDARALARLHRLGGDDLIRKIIDICLAQLPVKIREARDRLEQRDLEGVANAAHSVKSSAGNVGAARLAAVAERIELLARQGEKREISLLLAEMEEAHDSARILLEQRKKELGK